MLSMKTACFPCKRKGQLMVRVFCLKCKRGHWICNFCAAQWEGYFLRYRSPKYPERYTKCPSPEAMVAVRIARSCDEEFHYDSG